MLQSATGVMDKPVAPDQVGGWKVLGVFHCQNLSWTVTARRGGQVLRAERLSQEQVRNFDAVKHWAAR